MSFGGSTPPGPGQGRSRSPGVLGWRARLEAVQRRLLRQPLVQRVQEVLRAYDRGGGAMLAGALAYYAFFTMVPALLLFVGLLGVFVEDPSVRKQVVAGLIDQLDPISEVATSVIDGLAGSGRTSSIIGLIGLLWGASGFYGALESSMARMFPGPGFRDFLQTRIRGLLAVALVLGSMVAAVIIIFGVPLVQTWLEQRCSEIDAMRIPLLQQACQVDLGSITIVGGILATMAVATATALVVYVAVPTDGASLRQALPSALLVGVAIGIFTSLFGLFAPFLVREWLTLGVVGSVFIALIWFRLVFQALLFGAAYARLRRDRDRAVEVPPRL